MSVASVAQLLENQGGGGDTFGTINIDNGTYSVNLSCPADDQLALSGAYVATRQWANGLFQTIAGMANYSTTAQANALYPLKTNLSGVVLNIPIATGFANGAVHVVDVLITNFLGTANNTVYNMNIIYSVGLDTTVFSGVCAFNAIVNNDTRLVVSIRNNGATTVADINVPISILAYNIA